MLSKQEALFDRDEKGILIPKKVFVKELNNEILIIPLTWGEWKKISASFTSQSTEDFDEQVILNHLIEPKILKEDLGFFKSRFASIIVKTILEYSSILPRQEDGEGIENPLEKIGS